MNNSFENLYFGSSHILMYMHVHYMYCLDKRTDMFSNTSFSVCYKY